MKIQIIDSIVCKADKELFQVISLCLGYKKTFWKQGQFCKKPKTYQASFLNKRTGLFLSGFLPKIKDLLKSKSVAFKIENEFEHASPEQLPSLPGIIFRPDQEYLIKQVQKKQRGVVLSPTGSGKTIIAGGIISMFPKSNILFLCNSFDIIEQTAEEFIKFGFDDIAVLGNGKKDMGTARIVASTVQTFARLKPKDYCEKFDVVIVDECHDIVLNGQYGAVLQNLLSPVRIGLTATFPKDKERALSIEGLLGPIIGELTIQEGVNLEIIAKPKIILVSVPVRNIDARSYNDFYKAGIIENRIRNKLIGKIIKHIIEKKETVLIMVKEIAHGENLQKLVSDLFDIEIEFVQGITESENRDGIKKLLESGKTKAVICTTVWKKGINIKSLQNIINAVGGKSEIQVLQFLGRGLRKTDTKDSVKIYDFVDPYRYLAEHFVQRLQIYIKNGWEIKGLA